jgi:hypothetical protein
MKPFIVQFSPASYRFTLFDPNILLSTLFSNILLSSSLTKQPLLSTALLRKFCKIRHQVFASLDFATKLFYRASPSALRPTPTLEDHFPVFISLGGLSLCSSLNIRNQIFFPYKTTGKNYNFM